MKFRESDSGRKIDTEWHRFREDARTTAFSLAEFGDIAIQRYDLQTARIDGSGNPRTYKLDPAIGTLGMAGVDIRKLNRH